MWNSSLIINELLSALNPRTQEAIEKMMQQESIFSDYALPELRKK